MGDSTASIGISSDQRSGTAVNIWKNKPANHLLTKDHARRLGKNIRTETRKSNRTTQGADN